MAPMKARSLPQNGFHGSLSGVIEGRATAGGDVVGGRRWLLRFALIHTIAVAALAVAALALAALAVALAPHARVVTQLQ